MKKIAILILILSSFSCGKITEMNNNLNDEITIIIRSPSQCVQKIIINRDNKGKYSVGGVTSYKYNQDFAGFDYIKEEFLFDIDSKKDVKYINEKISSLKKSNIVNDQKKDAFRVELFVNNHKKVDVYGDTPDELLEVLNCLKKHFASEVDYACW